jgi:hypothetical protein
MGLNFKSLGQNQSPQINQPVGAEFFTHAETDRRLRSYVSLEI